MGNLKSFFRDLSRGITPAKRRQLNREYDERLKKERDEIFQHFEGSPVAQECFAEVCKKISDAKRNNESYVHFTIERAKVVAIGPRHSDDGSERYGYYSFSDHGFADIKKDKLCVFVEWFAQKLKQNFPNDKITGTRSEYMDFERAKSLGASEWGYGGRTPVKVWHCWKYQNDIIHAGRYLNDDKRADDVCYAFSLTFYKPKPEPSPKAPVKEW